MLWCRARRRGPAERSEAGGAPRMRAAIPCTGPCLCMQDTCSGAIDPPTLEISACCRRRCSQHVVAMLKCVDEKQWAWHWSCMEQHAALQKCYLENQEPPGWASSKFWKSVTRGLESARAWWRPNATSSEAAAGSMEASSSPGRPSEGGPSIGGASNTER